MVQIQSCPLVEAIQQWVEQRGVDGEEPFINMWLRRLLHYQLPSQITTDGGAIGPPQDGAIAKTLFARGPAFATGRPGSVAANSAAAAIVASFGLCGLCSLCSLCRDRIEPWHRDRG